MTMSRLLAAALLAVFLAPSLAQAQDTLWVDVAGATWRSGDGSAHVAAGFSGTQPSPQAATNAALQQCQASGGRGCQNLGPVRGCAYIAVGHYDGGVAWGAGGTPEDAIEQVRAAGATSWKQPIGGCGR
jgi:hypothetical protein